MVVNLPARKKEFKVEFFALVQCVWVICPKEHFGIHLVSVVLTFLIHRLAVWSEPI